MSASPAVASRPMCRSTTSTATSGTLWRSAPTSACGPGCSRGGCSIHSAQAACCWSNRGSGIRGKLCPAGPWSWSGGPTASPSGSGPLCWRGIKEIQRQLPERRRPMSRPILQAFWRRPSGSRPGWRSPRMKRHLPTRGPSQRLPAWGRQWPMYCRSCGIAAERNAGGAAAAGHSPTTGCFSFRAIRRRGCGCRWGACPGPLRPTCGPAPPSCGRPWCCSSALGGFMCSCRRCRIQTTAAPPKRPTTGWN